MQNVPDFYAKVFCDEIFEPNIVKPLLIDSSKNYSGNVRNTKYNIVWDRGGFLCGK